MSRMTPFQRRADRLLLEHGWEFVRFTGKSYTAYRKGAQTTTVANSPKNEHTALKQVRKYAGIR